MPAERTATALSPRHRRVLLAVTGLTPQVITETLYALMREGRNALPHEVHILTARQRELATLTPTARAMREFLDARLDKNQSELSALNAALKRGQWSGDTKIAIATHVKAAMQQAQEWKEKSEKKIPLKDHDHQDTLLVMKWLAGQ